MAELPHQAPPPRHCNVAWFGLADPGVSPENTPRTQPPAPTRVFASMDVEMKTPGVAEVDTPAPGGVQSGPAPEPTPAVAASAPQSANAQDRAFADHIHACSGGKVGMRTPKGHPKLVAEVACPTGTTLWAEPGTFLVDPFMHGSVKTGMTMALIYLPTTPHMGCVARSAAFGSACIDSGVDAAITDDLGLFANSVAATVGAYALSRYVPILNAGRPLPAGSSATVEEGLASLGLPVAMPREMGTMTAMSALTNPRLLMAAGGTTDAPILAKDHPNVLTFGVVKAMPDGTVCIEVRTIALMDIPAGESLRGLQYISKSFRAEMLPPLPSVASSKAHELLQALWIRNVAQATPMEPYRGVCVPFETAPLVTQEAITEWLNALFGMATDATFMLTFDEFAHGATLRRIATNVLRGVFKSQPGHGLLNPLTNLPTKPGVFTQEALLAAQRALPTLRQLHSQMEEWSATWLAPPLDRLSPAEFQAKARQAGNTCIELVKEYVLEVGMGLHFLGTANKTEAPPADAPLVTAPPPADSSVLLATDTLPATDEPSPSTGCLMAD